MQMTIWKIRHLVRNPYPCAGDNLCKQSWREASTCTSCRQGSHIPQPRASKTPEEAGRSAHKQRRPLHLPSTIKPHWNSSLAELGSRGTTERMACMCGCHHSPPNWIHRPQAPSARLSCWLIPSHGRVPIRDGVSLGEERFILCASFELREGGACTEPTGGSRRRLSPYVSD